MMMKISGWEVLNRVIEAKSPCKQVCLCYGTSSDSDDYLSWREVKQIDAEIMLVHVFRGMQQ